MLTIYKIDQPGDYNDIEIIGENRNSDLGLHIDVWGTQPVNIGAITGYNVFLPLLITGDAPVHIDKQLYDEFGGDGINIRGSNNRFGRTTIANATPTRPYHTIILNEGESVEAALDRLEMIVYDPSLLVVNTNREGQRYVGGYHVDAIQMYATAQGRYHATEDDVLRNIIMDEVDIQLRGSHIQGIAMTEVCLYEEIYLGGTSFRVELDYYYSVMAVNLSNFEIGVGDAVVNKPVRLQQPMGKISRHKFVNGVIGFPGDHRIDQHIATNVTVRS